MPDTAVWRQGSGRQGPAPGRSTTATAAATMCDARPYTHISVAPHAPQDMNRPVPHRHRPHGHCGGEAPRTAPGHGRCEPAEPPPRARRPSRCDGKSRGTRRTCRTKGRCRPTPSTSPMAPRRRPGTPRIHRFCRRTAPDPARHRPPTTRLCARPRTCRRHAARAPANPAVWRRATRPSGCSSRHPASPPDRNHPRGANRHGASTAHGPPRRYRIGRWPSGRHRRRKPHGRLPRV